MSSADTPNAPRLSSTLLASWGLGTLAAGVLFNSTSTLLLRYLTDFVGVPAALAGVLIATSKIYDAAIDPYIGWLSDRTRSRWGRRRPWLFVGSLLCGSVLVALFNIPTAWTPTASRFYLSGLLLLFASAYSIFNIPYMAMPAEMTSDSTERVALMSYRVTFIGLAQVVGGYGAPLLIEYFGGGREGHASMSLVLGTLITASGLLCFAGTRTAPGTPRCIGGSGSVREMALAFVDNRPFISLVAAKCALYAGAAAFASTLTFFVVHVLHRSYVLLGTYSLVANISMFVTIPAWSRLVRRFDRKRVFIAAGLIYALTCLSWLLASGPEALQWIMFRAAVTGAMGCGTLLSGQALLPDAIEYDFLKTSRRREGVFAGVYTTAEKVASAVGLSLTAALIGGMGYVAASGNSDLAQPPAALRAILLSVSVIPAGLFALSCIFMATYNLPDWKLTKMRQQANAGASESTTTVPSGPLSA